MDQHFRAYVKKDFTVRFVRNEVTHATKETINALLGRPVLC